MSMHTYKTCLIDKRRVFLEQGSCCDLRQHECKPHNRGLNNKCYDDCMCEEGERLLLFYSLLASLGALASASAHLFMCSCVFGSLPPSLTVYN